VFYTPVKNPNSLIHAGDSSMLKELYQPETEGNISNHSLNASRFKTCADAPPSKKVKVDHGKLKWGMNSMLQSCKPLCLH
jgi:hypothetical protein